MAPLVTIITITQVWNDDKIVATDASISANQEAPFIVGKIAEEWTPLFQLAADTMEANLCR